MFVYYKAFSTDKASPMYICIHSSFLLWCATHILAYSHNSGPKLISNKSMKIPKGGNQNP